MKKADKQRENLIKLSFRLYIGSDPFQGYGRLTWDLKDAGYGVNHKRVYRLMKIMGLQAIYPKRNLSKRNQQHKVYPYLLKAHPPQKPHDAWHVDIRVP